MRGYLTEKAKRDLEKYFALRLEAEDIFHLVVAEWESDPLSTQCFDLRIVKKAIQVSSDLKKLGFLA